MKCLTLLLLSLSVVQGLAVPSVLRHQGRIVLGGTNFNGTGNFKFAIVDAAGTETYWSHDGSSELAKEPDSSVAIPVRHGRYSVALGTGSMLAIPPGTFNNGDAHLRVWFKGQAGFVHLTPDARIGTVAYATVTEELGNGAVTTAKLANGAVTNSKLVNGTIQSSAIAAGAMTNSRLASGAIGSAQLGHDLEATDLGSGAALENLADAGLAAVPAGGIVLSGVGNQPALGALGFQGINEFDAPSSKVFGWSLLAEDDLLKRSGHTVVNTGQGIMIWGGQDSNGQKLNTGAWIENANGNVRPITTTLAPSARNGHSAVWAADLGEMLIFGGQSSNGTFQSDCSAYDPVTDAWKSLASSNSSDARAGHTAVWTGTEMIVFGGRNSDGIASGGLSLVPGESWQSLPAVPPGAENDLDGHSALWTGEEMIIWGGTRSSKVSTNTGARYRPGSGWSLMATTGAPRHRTAHSAVWTGSRMIVYGGIVQASFASGTFGGASYDPATNTWTPIAEKDAPVRTANAAHDWTGTEMIVYGGEANGVARNSGARYRPGDDRWIPIDSTEAPPSASAPRGIWNGESFVTWFPAEYGIASAFTLKRRLGLQQRP